MKRFAHEFANRRIPQVVWNGWLGGRTSSSGNTGLFLAPAKVLQYFQQEKSEGY